MMRIPRRGAELALAVLIGSGAAIAADCCQAWGDYQDWCRPMGSCCWTCVEIGCHTGGGTYGLAYNCNVFGCTFASCSSCF